MGFFSKISEGLKKTRESLKERFDDVFSGGHVDEDLFDELEEALVLADTGAVTAGAICEELRKRVKKESVTDPEKVREMMYEVVAEMLRGGQELDLENKPAIIMMIGVNGAGKTSLLNIIYGKGESNSGTVNLRKGTKIGFLRQHADEAYESRTVYEVIHSSLREEYKTKAEGVLISLGIPPELHSLPLSTLSGGQKTRVALAAVMMGDYDIIILDEPFSGLDPVNAMLLKDVVKGEIAKGKIVLFSSHQMNYIEEFCDSIAIINGGEVVIDACEHVCDTIELIVMKNT